ncbi:RNA polymerase, sigma 28 subunit, FliA/WhiG [Petrotoga mobilis SJ95]|jgi:RNA polymerase sigma factor for flagellar operon FliA|uniref:RNA polymerase, sigma 28 subunit, FliA/WhiG n=1 Tax=Petrotoga mobilis (strain DSM 10674 / SJ95) TaxID=403833 RepID=A9BHZ2_PETMO|nr:MULTISPECIES: FliA/WhiG family RNA polymerase sigma factor [Petrotoga]MDK2812252.1 polymerase sigma factor FliA [Petrotoga sp.]ABX32107.1 RNA polymerase, sigma 28 subunit, FliA/WhiG [Petrotoga mobilis SJ95]MBL5981429.1 RNA polymerase subunit sigma-28 [Petrotoga sp. 8T1HF07.NaAc.6.1]PNR90066.1 RNA polymerase subunit sigma-28 [Petrotoga sp. 9T1HF07.CasAA.8.2]PNR92352.1 RNA polymerase subunit sigma-28 [Petrotoga sp. HWHPT.55.6.3]
MKYKINEEQLVMEFLPKIKIIALNLKTTLPKNIELEDLIQEGIIGLLQSYKRYNPEKGTSFYTYALKRIKGSMYDYLRRIDWLPKDVRSLVKKYEDLIYECKDNEYIDDNSVAEKLHIEKNDVDKIKFSLSKRQILQLDEYFLNNEEDTWLEDIQEENDPEILAYKDMLHDKLTESIEKLEEREKLILSLYYNEGLTFKEIGSVLEISESRVSQLHSVILVKLKKMIQGSE